MSAEVEVARKGLKILEWLKRWRIRLAYNRHLKAKQEAIKAANKVAHAAAALVFVVASGCSSLDEKYIAYDQMVGAKLQPMFVPEGYEVRPFVRNAQGDRTDITGWTVELEMIKASSWQPTPLTINASKSPSALPELIEYLRGQVPASVGSGGSADAQQLLIDAATREGLK